MATCLALDHKVLAVMWLTVAWLCSFTSAGLNRFLADSNWDLIAALFMVES